MSGEDMYIKLGRRLTGAISFGYWMNSFAAGLFIYIVLTMFEPKD